MNMSIPVCKLCESMFDFIDGIHSRNLNYECDCDSKFGLYDYSLLINLKSWNKIFFSLTVNTCDLKDDDENNKNILYYIDKSQIVNQHPINFDLKSLVIKDSINNFMIFDIMFLTSNGDHVLCDSKPIILRPDKSRIDYDEYNSDHYIDLISPIIDKEGKVPVFTPDHKMISQDCRHLTQFGSQFYASILSDKIQLFANGLTLNTPLKQ